MFRKIPELQVFQDPLDDGGIVDKADNTKATAAFRANERIRKIHFANQTSPDVSAEAAIAVVGGFIGIWDCASDGSRQVLTPALSPSLVAVVSIIAHELESFFRDKGYQNNQGVQRGEPLRGAGIHVGALQGVRIIGDNAGVPVVMEANERKGGMMLKTTDAKQCS